MIQLSPQLRVLLIVVILLGTFFLVGLFLPRAETPISKTGHGLKITKFEPENPEVMGTGVETLELFLEVQNVGDAIATNVEAQIFNYGDLLGPTQAHLGILEPPEEKIEGERQDYTFVYIVPKRQLGVRDTLDLGARVSYEYASWGTADIYVVPKDDWKAKQELGVKSPRLDKFSSEGPIQVKISARHPIIVSPHYDTFSIRVDVDNIGTGSVRSMLFGYDTLDAIDLVVPPGFSLGEYCDFAGTLGAYGGTLTVQFDPLRLKMTKGKHKTLTCRLRVNDITRENVYPFMAVVRYRYQIDGFTTLTIHGTPG
jgi:hypothetical protein